jgi:hypothetical protein
MFAIVCYAIILRLGWKNVKSGHPVGYGTKEPRYSARGVAGGVLILGSNNKAHYPIIDRALWLVTAQALQACAVL